MTQSRHKNKNRFLASFYSAQDKSLGMTATYKSHCEESRPKSGRRGNLLFASDNQLNQIASFDYAQDKSPQQVGARNDSR